jgi:nucleotide-binding universal stress UspA family protein
MYKTIIVPLDGSARSQAALPAAAMLAKACAAPLDLVRVHVLDRPDLEDDPSWDDMFRQGEQRYLDALAEAYGSVAGGAVTTALLDPPVAEAICDHASGRTDPLIVMTARGRTGIRRALLGSVSDGVVRNGSAPVLIFRDSPQRRAPRDWSRPGHPVGTIIVPLDGTAFAETALAHAIALARAVGAKLHLVRALASGGSSSVLSAFAMHPLPPVEESAVLRNDLARDYLQGVVYRIAADGRSPAVSTEVVVTDHPGAAIVGSCRRHDAGAVVMATHGRGGSRLLVGSVADHLLREGPEAVLFVHPDDGRGPLGLRYRSHAEPRAIDVASLRVPVVVD